ncbi:MAG: DNA-formamidopyrimidine glycosylase [Candidatus Staskawiczbacteria bacterium RIFCSPHIGHO2_12_FULL_38_11]|uniref:DNA-formamidopyrimidine glycosylase n=1 Tax=Candidatus Staskawiczbacteria bacterium RIFCSPHIGHO2_12_FULL_38_11 TaxID=1802209 RepID=A0A1G2I906_9BACT|nr:MAG: DNA-formamidopyrimidine glycosylase [Candidatus Staskawiczbacteria bacterium RIFCSPHIGHO2_12_FULL_38_11]
MTFIKIKVMPELPEVQTTVDGLNKKVLNRTFVDVWSDWKKTVKKPKDFDLFKKELKGKKIKKIWRRAKNVIFELSDGYSLLVHMKMTGHLMVARWKMEGSKWQPVKKGPLEEKINTFLHIIFFMDDGQMIALSDLRKFAKVELWRTEEFLASAEFNGWGPEPLEKSFTFEKFKEVLKGKKGKIKQVIMVPEVIAGIGNIYSNEALWWSKIHPEKSVAKLSQKELKALYDAIKKVLLAGIKLRGESFSDYRDVDGKKGNFDDERRVYKREKEPCQRCKTTIKRIKFGGRSAFFCPTCQKL